MRNISGLLLETMHSIIFEKNIHVVSERVRIIVEVNTTFNQGTYSGVTVSLIHIIEDVWTILGDTITRHNNLAALKSAHNHS